MSEKVVKLTPEPSIEICAGELPRMVTEAQRALIRTGAGIYQRGGQLVRVVVLDARSEKDGIRRAAGSFVIMPVTKEYLRLVMCRVITWRKYDMRSKKHVIADAPQTVAAALMSAAGEWQFPHLAGIVCAPTIRSDGTLLQQPGYDSDSYLYGAFNAGDFPQIDPNPTRSDAKRALDVIEDLFRECVFAGGHKSAHASALVAATLTACVRPALRTAPAFAVSAAKAGSGKTTAANAIAHVSIGREPPVVSLGEDETELRKALLSMLIAGDSVILIDNVARPVDSAALCAILTSPTYRDRVLGASQHVTVSTASTWLVTGNSLEFVGDLTSRTLLSVLDPMCEQPEARTFARDLGAYVAEHRGELVAAALTIPLAYVAAGCPEIDGVRRSRFREWDALVRRPLLWLDAADPLDSQAELRSIDPHREALAAVLGSWREEFGEDPTTVAQAIERTARVGMSACPRLRDALTEVAGERDSSLNARRLGKYLKRSVRRIEGGLRLEDCGSDPLTHRRTYRVIGVTGVTGVSFPLPARDCSDVSNRGPVGANAGNAGYEGGSVMVSAMTLPRVVSQLQTKVRGRGAHPGRAAFCTRPGCRRLTLKPVCEIH